MSLSIFEILSFRWVLVVQILLQTGSIVFFISDVPASGFCASGGFESAGAKFASDGKWAGSPRLRLDTSLVCDTLVVFHHLSIP